MSNNWIGYIKEKTLWIHLEPWVDRIEEIENRLCVCVLRGLSFMFSMYLSGHILCFFYHLASMCEFQIFDLWNRFLHPYVCVRLRLFKLRRKYVQQIFLIRNGKWSKQWSHIEYDNNNGNSLELNWWEFICIECGYALVFELIVSVAIESKHKHWIRKWHASNILFHLQFYSDSIFSNFKCTHSQFPLRMH